MYTFEDRLFLLKALWPKFGPKSLIRQFRYHSWRPYSRRLIKKYLSSLPGNTVLGVEIGVGAQTIAPIQNTILSDAFQSHAADASLATEIFPADQIPYPDAHFHFLLSEHVLEHLPNPLRVLREWKRVIKPGGFLFLFLPHPDRTFDQGRELTSLDHLIQDEIAYRAVGAVPGVTIKDLENAHYHEWTSTVIVAGRAPHYHGLSQEEVLKTNSLHRHVWNEKTMAEVLTYVGFTVVHQEARVPDRMDSFVVIARA